MIDKNLKKKDVLIEISRLYYIEKRSQQEIADLFDTTRSNIAKLLKQAEETGIVEIRIADPSSNTIKLGNKLKEKYNLLKVIVVPTESEHAKTMASLGKVAAEFLVSQLRNNTIIGMSWGTTLFQMVEQMPTIVKPDITVVQLHGGAGSRNMMVDGSDLSRTLSLKLSCSAHYIPAPLVVQSKELKEMLLREPHISEGLLLSEKVDIAFLGIGTSIPKYSALVRAGFLAPDEAKRLFQEGAVGMICGQFYTINGELLHSDINDRIIGLDVHKLQNIKYTIGLACGEEKVDAILGALNGSYINTLFTDEFVANQLLKNNK